MDVNYNFLLDYIYQKSNLNFFIKFNRIEQPHFTFYSATGVQYITVDHFKVEARMPSVTLSVIEQQFGLDINKSFIDVLITEAQQNLEKHFISYIDEHSIIEKLPFYRNTFSKILIKFFDLNARFSLTKRGVDYRKGLNILAILKHYYKELYSYITDDSVYAIVSPQIAQIIGQTYEETSDIFLIRQKIENPKPGMIFPFMVLSNLSVYVDPKINQNTIYMGTVKRYDKGVHLFHYNSQDSITEYTSLPTTQALDMQKIYVINMYYKFFEIDSSSIFKKIILEV